MSQAPRGMPGREGGRGGAGGPERPGGPEGPGEPGGPDGTPAAVRRALALYRPLLGLIPGRIRERRREEMLDTFHALAIEAHALGGRWALVRLWTTEVADLLRAAADGRLRGLRFFLFRTASDTGYALRRLRRTPGFAGIAVLSLALVIGGNATIFSVVNAVLLRVPPQENPAELVEVYFEMPGFPYGPLSEPDVRDVRERAPDLLRGFASSRYLFVPREVGGSVEVLAAEGVSGNYFTLQGLRAEAGRVLADDDDRLDGGEPVAVLSHPYWRKAFDADPAAVGSEIRLGTRSFTVVGVAPEGYPGMIRGLVPDLFLPVSIADEVLPLGFDMSQSRGSYSTFVRARLAPGVTAAQAADALGAVTRSMRTDFEEWGEENRLRVVASADVAVNPMIDPYVKGAGWALLALVVLVLLVACANLASFLLAQGAERRKEIAVRLALGSGRGALIRQLLVETLLLALAGGVLGVMFAWWATGAIAGADLPLPVPITLDLRPDVVVLGWTAGITLLAGLLFGLAPALQSTRTPMASTLRDESGASGGRIGSRLRDGLVAAQVAISVVCLIAAGLFLRNLEATRAIDPGFGTAPTALVQFVVPADRYDTLTGPTFVSEMTGRVEELPGVEAAAAVGNLPLDQANTSWTDITVPGVPPPAGQELHRVDYSQVHAGYFEAAGVPLLQGRAFDERDRRGSERVGIVSRAMAERFWPERGAVGRTFFLEDGREMRVVGVAADTKVRTLGESPRPFLYVPLTQTYTAILTVVARTRGDAAGELEAITRTMREAEPGTAILRTSTMERHVAILVLPARLAALAFGAFAALALVLSLTGLYGVVRYNVARRSREMGIRLSLGASPRAVVRLVVVRGLALVALGGAVGLALSVAVSVGLRSLLFHVEALDPITYLAAPALLATVALVAAWIPARRAARVDPAGALRGE